MKLHLALAAIATLLLSACVTPISSTPSGPSGPSIPSAPLSLGGDWRNASVGATLERFQREVAGRYEAGLALSDASGDLRRQEFNCSAGRGENAPQQVCRKTETAGDCTHTWQVHLFAADDVLARSRALYDRRCGGDGLLGGPT